MRKCSGAIFVLVIANAVVSFAAWGQRSTAQAYKNAAGMFADVSEAKSPSAALMVAKNMAKGASFTSTLSIQTIGVCTEADVSVMSSISVVPGAAVESYQRNVERLSNWMVPPKKETVTVLENPAHGTLSETSVKGQYLYTPSSGYAGSDAATFLVDTGSGQFKLVYSIKVYDSGDGSNQTGCDYPNVWRISLNQNNVDPSAVAFGLPDALSNQLLKNVNVSLNVVKLTDVNVLASRSSSIALSERDVEYGWVLKLRSKIPSGSRRKEVAI